MKIKSIHLQNWQAHSDLKLDFNEDINIITGLSNKGKSSIRRAVGWVCFADSIAENDLRKEGTKKTTVTVVFDNDIEIERVRSASINRYILRTNDAEQVFDSFGKEVPEEVRLVINLAKISVDGDDLNLNIAEQLTLPFLLDKPASFRAKLFNKLTGNEMIDVLFKNCNKDSLHFSRELKEKEEIFEKQKNELVEYSEKYELYKDKLADVQMAHIKIKDDIEIYETLKKLSENLSENKQMRKDVREKSKSIKLISEDKLNSLKEKVLLVKKIEDLYSNFKKIKSQLKDIEKSNNVLTDYDFTNVKNKINNLKSHEKLQEALNVINSEESKTDVSIFRIKNDTDIFEKELKDVLKDIEICPICKQKVCNEKT